jgi:DNA-binding transcriptional regulator LsrR (DeoR family)
VNLFDIDSMHSMSNARRDRFMEEARQDRIARELGVSRQRVPSRFRRAIGMGLIHAGSRLSGVNNGDARRVDSPA